jgi:hypothetical protein
MDTPSPSVYNKPLFERLLAEELPRLVCRIHTCGVGGCGSGAVIWCIGSCGVHFMGASSVFTK